jgi:hypothetical protein
MRNVGLETGLHEIYLTEPLSEREAKPLCAIKPIILQTILLLSY